MDKPRTQICWHCSGKLQNDHHIEKPVPKWSGDDIPRILHKCCGKSYDEGNNQSYDVGTHFEVEDVREPDEFESYGKIWV